MAGWTKKLTGKPTISVGSVGLSEDFTHLFTNGPEAGSALHQLNSLVERMQAEEFDLIAVGRALIGDPAWAAKIHHGRENEIHHFSKDDLNELI